MSHVVDVTVSRRVLCLLLICVLGPGSSVTQSISKLGPKKRGGGWGYTAHNVSGELEAMPVRWWYNWGNGIPNPAAQALTAVQISLSSPHWGGKRQHNCCCPSLPSGPW